MQKNSLKCTLRYLKYICSLTLMCLIHSFNKIYFNLQCNKQSGNYECGLLYSGCRLLCKLKLIEVETR